MRLSAAAFIVAAAYVPGIFAPSSMPKWWAFAVGLALASDLDPRRVPAVYWLGVAWAAVTLAWTPVPGEALLDVYFLILIGFGIGAAAALDDLGPVLSAFCWGLSLSSALAVAQWLGWNGIPSVGPSGLFMNSELLAETAAPLLAWAILRRRFAEVTIAGVPLLICGSRVAVVAVAAALVLTWRPRRRWARPALLLLIAVAAASTLVILGPGKLQSGMDRAVLWLAAIDSVTLLGRGVGWWAVAHSDPLTEFAHSDALQLVVETGVGAALFFAVPVAALLGGAGKPGERAAFAAVCIEAVVSFPLHVPATAFLAAILAGSLVGARSRLRRARPHGGAVAVRPVRRQAAQGGGGL
jgi:hypothetical protein